MITSSCHSFGSGGFILGSCRLGFYVADLSGRVTLVREVESVGPFKSQWDHGELVICKSVLCDTIANVSFYLYPSIYAKNLNRTWHGPKPFYTSNDIDGSYTNKLRDLP